MTRSEGRGSSLELATRAAEEVLSRSGCSPNDVGLIVYTGLYCDDNVCEPAIAPFIQQELGINPVYTGGGAPTTFSFDIANGACGFVNGLQVVDGFIASGRARYGLVVTSDVDSTPGSSEGASFEPGGGAVLLAASDGSEGFSAFASESFGKHSKLRDGRVRWRGAERESSNRPLQARHTLTIHEAPEFVDRCSKCAALAISVFLERRGLAVDDIDVFAVSSAPPGLKDGLARELSLPPESLSALPDRSSHTAGPAEALVGAIENPRWPTARRALLVAAGAGISVALALYTQDRSA